MTVSFKDGAWGDYQHWSKTDQDILERVNRLIEDARCNLFKGIGKPEPMKGNLAGW